MKQKKIDRIRTLAVLVVVFAVIYFYLNVFSPRSIPKSLRIGVVRKPINLLILGTDITYNAETLKPMPSLEGRTDTILLAHVDPIKYQINLLSIPRDTYISIPGYGMTKINSANVYGGVFLTKDAVANFIGKKIDYYIKIKPTAVTKLVGLIGGIYLFVEKDMHYVDRAQNLNINLKEGWRKLSGKQAHDYIRFRDDFQGDIGRIERQQKFLKAVMQALIKPANILKAPFALYTAFQEIKTDLPPSQTLRLINLLRMASIKTTMISGEVFNMEGAGSVWLPDKAAIDRTIKEYF